MRRPHAESYHAAFSAARLLIISLTALSVSSAQSLNPDKPSPVASAPNRAAVDCFIGPHYWTFTAEPGKFVAELVLGDQQGGMLGPNRVRAGVYFAPKTPNATVTTKTTKSGAIYEGSVTERTRVIIEIAPRKGTLLRETSDYVLQVSGDVSFGAAGADESQSIIGSYIAKHGPYGAVKFQSDGHVMAANGAEGTWKLFEAEAKLYSVKMSDGIRYTVVLSPGRGLLDPNSQTFAFERLRQ